MLIRIRSARSLLAAASWFALSSCSLILDWTPEGLPCDTEKKCADSFSCLVNRCVSEGSLAVGDTCSASAQCADYPNNICGSNPFTCRKKCQSNYYTNASGICNTGEYCRPEAEREHPDQWTGTCVASECTGNDQCHDRSSTSKACVSVSATSNACLQSCTVTVSAGVYHDTCGNSTGLVYCQPVGPTKPSPTQSLVCLTRLDNNIAAQPNTGDLCKVVENACRQGDACVGEPVTYCRTYCDVGANDGLYNNPYCPAAAKFCCQVLSNGVPLYAVCMDSSC